MLVRPSRRFWREDFLESRWFSLAWPPCSCCVLENFSVGDLSAVPRSVWGGARSPPRPPQERLRHGNRSRVPRALRRALRAGCPSGCARRGRGGAALGLRRVLAWREDRDHVAAVL